MVLKRSRLAVLLLVACGAVPPVLAVTASSTTADYWPLRQGVAARVLLISPPNSWGAVILLAGGHGNLNLAQQGQIGWGQDDFLVRTRASYVAAGLTVAIPDVPSDMKPPISLSDYRTSDKQAYDLRAVSGRLRRMVERVWLIGFDQAAASVLTTVADEQADLIAGLILVSPVLDGGAPDDRTRAAVATAVRTFPMLVMYHDGDACSTGAVARFDKAAAAASGPDYRSVKLTGGNGDDKLPSHLSFYPDRCNRTAAHALAGLESQASSIIVDWLAARKPPQQ